MYRVHLVIFVTFITITLSARVIWLPNISFNLPMSFNTGKLPCSKETVVFPETMSGSVMIESGTSVSGFILPENGEIFLGEGLFGLGPTDDAGCTTGNVYYMQSTVASWAQPDVWTSERINDATPDAERVPCFDDTVEFPINNTFTVVLPDVTQKVQSIKLRGDTIYKDFKEYILRETNDAQQFILNEFHDTGIVVGNYFSCHSRSGCPCQYNTLDIDCAAKFCEIPTCVSPIQPIGHCCKICGGAINFDINENFDIMQFQELVDKIIDTYGKDKLVYHIGRLLNKVQVVVIDKNGYDQTSAEVVSAISHNMEGSLRQDMHVSGSPLSKSGLGGKIFISMFFAVVLVMAGIYVYYYKVPHINYPNILGRHQASMFSRFNRRTESVVSLTRRDSAAGPIGIRAGTAFRNPLYDSQRGRVLVEESEIEE